MQSLKWSDFYIKEIVADKKRVYLKRLDSAIMGVVLKCLLEPGCNHALWQQFSIKDCGWKVLMVMCYSLCNLIERYQNVTSWQLRSDINQKCRYLMTWRWGPTRTLYFSGFTVLTFHSFLKFPKETKNWGREKNRWNPHTAFNTVHLIQIPLLRFFFYRWSMANPFSALWFP